MSRSGALLLAGSLLAAPPLTAQDGAATAAPATASEPQATEDAPVLLVRPSGVYLDLAEQGGDLTTLLTGGGSKPKPFYEMLEQLRDAAGAASPTLLFDLSGSFQLNAPQLAELERTIRSLRAAGKRSYAYLEHADSGAYSIAALCDHVMMADLGVLELGSPALSVTFLKDAFDLIGVHMDVVRCGDFKGAVEPYVLPRMSEHLRAHYVTMLDRINQATVERIASGRGMSSSAVRSAQAQRIFTARDALAAGFVDELVPWAGAKAAFAKATKSDDAEYRDALEQHSERKNVNVLQMLSQLFNPKKDEKVEEESIVVLHLSGGILDGTKPQAGSIVSGPTVDTIRRLVENDQVKGVVVRINSPGGSATASEAILLALRELAERKPVVVSMGSLAASGGYYVTCLGRPILAEEGTITGSIGVFGMKPSLGALLRRVGVHEELVALDASAGMTSLSEPWSDESKARMQRFVDQIYDVFVGHVARSRGKTTSEVLAIAGGRVWSGAQAVEVGLVDRIGGLHDAIAMVREEAKVGEDADIRHLPQPTSFFETLFADGMVELGGLLEDPALQLVAKRLELDRPLRIVLDSLTSERPATVWAMMPEAIRLR